MEHQYQLVSLVVNDFVSQRVASTSPAFELLAGLLSGLLTEVEDLDDHLAVAELVISKMPSSMALLVKMADELSLGLKLDEASAACVHEQVGTALYLNLFETCLKFLTSLEECRLSISVRSK
jgi:hypothetical protein